MRRAAQSLLHLVAVFALLACHEPGPPTRAQPPAHDGDAPQDRPAQTTAGSPSVDAGHVSIVVVGNQLKLGDETIVPVRPHTAPGALDPSMEPSYAYPKLRSALGNRKVDQVELPMDANMSTLRGIVVSATAPGDTFKLKIVGTNETLPVQGPGSQPARALIRPRLGNWELWIDGTRQASAKQIAVLGKTVRELDPRIRRHGVAFDLPDALTIADLANAAQLLPEGTAATIAIEHAPCLPAPPDMVCIPGGPAIVGYDKGLPEERPSREIVVSTYYIDQYEVSIEKFDECNKAGACKRRQNGGQNIMKPFVGAKQPAMPMDWLRARAYCAWAGKRLPTEWEWEKAARGPDGDLYPWGNEPPSCDRAVYRECAPAGCTPYPGKAHRWDCNEHNTKPVGSFPPGHYGLYDMAGNGYEWTASAGVDSIAECGQACQGTDPLGRCDGAYPCEGKRVLKGGSWYWPKHRTRGSHRRIEKIRTGSHRLGMRCATSSAYLTRFPPRHFREKRPQPEALKPPTQAQLAIFSTIEDDPIQDKPICGAKVREQWHPSQSRGGRSTTQCRDPFPYLMSNEPRGYLWTPYIANLGGAYFGIGSDQNYSYIAAARSRWAWVGDYDPRVYRNHLRLRAFILHAQTPKAFVAFFSEDGEAAAVKVLDEVYADHPLRNRLRYGYLATRDKLQPYFERQLKTIAAQPKFGWLSSRDNYDYIRTMVTQGRLMPVKSDLLGDKAIVSIGEAARKLGTPVRIYYSSNAPSAWGGEVTDAYRRNVLGLPFDHLSVALQTDEDSGFRRAGKWHHSVQFGPHLHARLRQDGYDTIAKLLEERIPGHRPDITILGLPSD